MRVLFDEVQGMLKISKKSGKTLSSVFQDNDVCRKPASSMMPKMTTRSEHAVVK